MILENCELPYANHGHVILADPSPILFYPISSTEIRCLVDVPGQKVPSVSNGEMSQYLKTVVAPQVSLYIHARSFLMFSYLANAVAFIPLTIKLSSDSVIGISIHNHVANVCRSPLSSMRPS